MLFLDREERVADFPPLGRRGGQQMRRRSWQPGRSQDVRHTVEDTRGQVTLPQFVGDDQAFSILIPGAGDLAAAMNAIGEVVEVDGRPEPIAQDSGLAEGFGGQGFAAGPVVDTHVRTGEIAEQ